VLLGSGGYGDRYCNSVLVDPNETDPQRRYKMTYYDWAVDGGREYAGLHVAFSADGIHWAKHPRAPLYRTAYGGKGWQPPFAGEEFYQETRLPDGRIRKQWAIPMSLSDAADVLYDPRRAAFVIYGKMWIQGPDGGLAWKHAMGRSESRDFLNWTEPELVCTTDDADPPGLEFHTSPVFFHRDRYFSLNQIMDRAAGGVMDIELMVSRDGLAWERPFRDTLFLRRGAAGAFDSGAIFTTSSFIVDGDEMRFYYGAYGSGAVGGGSNIFSDDQKSGVGLATLPLDRFAGVRSVPAPPTPNKTAPASIGQITLKPLDLTGCREITVNADASAGAVRAELLTPDGYRVRGFSKDDAVALRGDSLRHQVRWKDRTLGSLPAGRYLLRLHLETAAVFAVTLK
jgi:hypothetical protein